MCSERFNTTKCKKKLLICCLLEPFSNKKKKYQYVSISNSDFIHISLLRFLLMFFFFFLVRIRIVCFVSNYILPPSIVLVQQASCIAQQSEPQSSYPFWHNYSFQINEHCNYLLHVVYTAYQTVKTLRKRFKWSKIYIYKRLFGLRAKSRRPHGNSAQLAAAHVGVPSLVMPASITQVSGVRITTASLHQIPVILLFQGLVCPARTRQQNTA